jgi:type I restriction enzyme R subunit
VAAVFDKKIRLIYALQESTFIGDEYQSFRTGLIEDVFNQIIGLNTERVDVKLKLRYVEKYKNKK